MESRGPRVAEELRARKTFVNESVTTEGITDSLLVMGCILFTTFPFLNIQQLTILWAATFSADLFGEVRKLLLSLLPLIISTAVCNPSSLLFSSGNFLSAV